MHICIEYIPICVTTFVQISIFAVRKLLFKICLLKLKYLHYIDVNMSYMEHKSNHTPKFTFSFVYILYASKIRFIA